MNPAFLADDMVARLGRWLRVLGCDTVIWVTGPDEAMLQQAAREGRTVVTRHAALRALAASEVQIFVLTEENPVSQLVELAHHFHLDLHTGRYTRCQECNGTLAEIGREQVRGKVPAQSLEAFDRFWRCRECGHIYWRGDHHASMEETLAWVEGRVGAI